MKKSNDNMILAILFVLLFVGGYFLIAPRSHQEVLISTTYNADPKGVKAFYTLLGRLGYSTDRLRRPFDKMPGEARVLISVQPMKYVNSDERSSLKNWVKSGGTVIFASDGLQKVPAAFGSTGPMGKGEVYAFNARKVITNEGMRRYKNGVDIVRIIDKHAGKGGLVLFDEYHHGIIEGESMFAGFASQVKIALAILAVAGLVLCHTRGKRFGAVRRLPSSETVRPGYEFVESVGGLYQRAGATGLAANILCDSFKHNLCARLGLPAKSSPQTVAMRMKSDGSAEMADRVEKLLASCGKSTAGQKPSEQELVNIAREIQNLEKELGLAGIGA